MNTETAREPAGLYLHVPFCSAICPYCDFAVLVGGADRRVRFIEALEIEVERVVEQGLPETFARGFDTVYFGGGTPSTLSPGALSRLLTTLRQRLPIAEDARIFFEANPEDIDEARLAAWRELGVATLSLGVQSFDDDELAFLGRRHRAAEAIRAVELARTAGFDTLSLDLIYGLPDQSEARWRRSLDTAIALEPDHLSCYELEVHQRTVFGKKQQRGELVEMPEPDQARLFTWTHRWLADAGIPAYEVSNFAHAPEHHSRHNRKYWYHVPYLGLGPSAHSFDGQTRFWNERHLEAWQRRLHGGDLPRAGEEILSGADVALETVMLALRTVRGLDLSDCKARFGIDLLARNRALIEEWIGDGYLRVDGDFLVPSIAGLLIADGMAAALDLVP